MREAGAERQVGNVAGAHVAQDAEPLKVQVVVEGVLDQDVAVALIQRVGRGHARVQHLEVVDHYTDAVSSTSSSTSRPVPSRRQTCVPK